VSTASPTSPAGPASAIRSHFGILSAYLRPLWPRVSLLAFLLLAGTGLQVVAPQLVRRVIDGAASGAGPQPLVAAAFLFLLVGLGNVLVSALRAYVGGDLGWRATNRLRADLTRHILALDLPFHEERGLGELLERIDADASALNGFLSTFALAVAGNALLLVGVLVVLSREQWWLGLGLAAFSAAMVVGLTRLRSLAAPHYRASRQANAAQMGFVAERVAGVEDIRTCGAVPYVMRRFRYVAVTAFQAGRRARVHGDLLGAVSSTLLKLGSLGALASGVYLHQTDAATIGTVYLIVHYAELLARPLRVLSSQADELQRTSAAADRIRELLAIAPAVRSGSARALPAGPLAVQVRDVSFRYGEGPLVLADVSFALRPGEVLGLLGRTGGGKSSMARLLFRFHDPTAGSITLGGVDVRQLSVEGLRRSVGLVTQDVQLFGASVRDNITLFDRQIPDSRVVEAIDSLSLRSWFERLSRGLDTILAPHGGRGAEGGGGVGLSAGEAQLLALTRVFLKDPGLVILDEASSRLDPATERLLERALDRLLSGRTAVIIAHRLSTIERADTVLILEDGRVREYGPRAALAGDAGSRLFSLLHSSAATVDEASSEAAGAAERQEAGEVDR